MDKTAQPRSAKKAIGLLVALLLGAALLPFTYSAAFAAEGAASQGSLVAGEGVVSTQDTSTIDFIEAVPSNSTSMYQAYSTYFEFTTPGVDANLINYDMGMRYRLKGSKTWKYYVGMDYVLEKHTISKLKPNKVYQVQLFYYKAYGDEITALSNVSKTVKIKTGMKKKPAIKSVSVQATNVRSHWQHVYGYVIYYGKVKYYTYRIKTTVTLKKVPKAKYIWINGKKFKANKKRYVVTSAKQSAYKKPYGKKWTVAAYTYDNKNYGGYSPMFEKNYKIR
ncbi:MAG: hypothetical protein IJI68_05910 [Eggerthellaceae bacterium]|nr:hypothetical protein [Eggerthellaceae bacterium]